MVQQPKAPFGLRMPDDIKKWLAQRAEENGRSMNAELVQLLKQERNRDRGERANA
ncbi:Arc family DNA-binding protein [Rhizobium sp. AC44/96]|uniref:Arc family DNA-binding protein n=1 Tax=Rhizobium sp. AC44/96 TaxID=1841654 RepID=UPI0009F6333C|nr:Arc family DNA-binding protein [Rhizobium sp. AC44/96]